MSYQVLARKWRPRNFQELVGQEHVLKVLSHALDHDRVHHAFLFTGTRGVGKTTIARILAKALNCEQGVSSTPCGQCATCKEIDAGRFFDLIEVDAASRTGVDDMRDLLDNAQYMPTQGRYKVYLIDEVHMLSMNSFNALLKTLEEPPPHIKFLLATTDPQRIPVTVLSRCLQFHLKSLSVEQIIAHLEYLLKEESIAYEPGGIRMIARAADGSMRDALSLLDQAISMSDGKIVETDTRDMLGVIERHFVLDIVRHLHEKNGSGVLEESQKISERAVSYPDVVADLIDLFYRIAVAQIVPAAVTDAAGEKEALCGYAKLFAPETIQLFYQLALNGRQDIAVAPDPRIAFEMLLLRLLTFSPVTPPSRNKMIEGGAGASDSAAPVSSTSLSSGVSNVSVAPNASIASNASIAQNASIAPNDSAKRGVATHTDTSAVSSQIAQAECDREGKGADTRLDSTEGEADIHELEEWGTALAKLKISGLVLQLALNCCVKYFTPSKVVFQLDNKNSHLKSPAQVDRLIAALNERYGALEVTIESVSDLIHTPAQQAERAEADRLLHAQQTLLDDPAFSAIMERFDAKIQSGSIKPH